METVLRAMPMRKTRNSQPSASKPRKKAVVAALTLFIAMAATALMVLIITAAIPMFFADRPDGKAAAAVSALKLSDIPFDGARAYESLKELCKIGPRPSGSAGMQAQQKLLADYFQKLGGKVEFQRFRARHPVDNSWVPMANLIVRWNPENKHRILLCAHYDTLPYPLWDPENPRGTFVGANDNASGVAVLMELGRDMSKLKCRYGVDFVFLDGEEFVFRKQDPYVPGSGDPMFLGARFFADEYAKEHPRPPYPYRWGVLLDMVGKTDSQFYEEVNSMFWRDTRPLVADIWSVARKLGVREFVAQQKHEIDDDHITLHERGHIPCIDIIDFDYMKYWHTQADTPDKCSPLSLAKVGWVIREWLKTVKLPQR
jgi:glutaminyl-peptide cyclotransferase